MPRTARKPTVPALRYSDALTVGQLANEWDRDTFFVRRLILEGKLVQDERGLITNAALHDFFRLHGTELD